MNENETRVYEASDDILDSLSNMITIAEGTHYDPSGAKKKEAEAWEEARELLKKAEAILKKAEIN